MWTLVIVGVVIFTMAIHEFGHFLSARAYGVVSPVIAIGFGRLLYKHRFGSDLKSFVEVQIRLLPFGAYVIVPDEEAQIPGYQENPKTALRKLYRWMLLPLIWLMNAMAPAKDMQQAIRARKKISDAGAFAQLMTSFAGPAANLLAFAIALFAFALVKGASVPQSLHFVADLADMLARTIAAAVSGFITGTAHYPGMIEGASKGSEGLRQMSQNGLPPVTVIVIAWAGINFAAALLNLLPLPLLDGSNVVVAALRWVLPETSYKLLKGYVMLCGMFLLALITLLTFGGRLPLPYGIGFVSAERSLS